MKIEPDKQFIASPERLAMFLKQYNLVFMDYTEASSGIENSTLITTTKQGKFVVRVYRQGKKSLSDINLEVNFINFLRENGIKIPEILQNNNGAYITAVELEDMVWRAIVMDFIEGVHVESYTHRLVTELATTQVLMHIQSSSYHFHDAAHIDELIELRDKFFVKQIDHSKITNTLLDDFLQRAQSYVVSLDKHLPKGLCHLDYDKENTITRNNSLAAVIDFDDLAIAPFVVCLSYTLWHVRQQSGKDMVKHYLSAYESVRPLSELEKSYLQPIMLFRHYFISSIKILNNHLATYEVNKYLSLEAELSN